MICVKPCAVPSSLMTSGKPTTARINNAAMTRNNLNRSAAFHVNQQMAKIFCIFKLNQPRMDTDKHRFERNLLQQFICVNPCPSVAKNHFLFPSSDDNFSSALDKSSGFISGAGLVSGIFVSVGCVNASSFLSSSL